MITLSPPTKHQIPKTAIQMVKPVAPKTKPPRCKTPGSATQRKKKRKFAQMQERLKDLTRTASSSAALPESMGGGMSSTSGSCAPRNFHLNAESGLPKLPLVD